MKLKVQAQHLQPGDVVGSGEVVCGSPINSIACKSGKIYIPLEGRSKDGEIYKRAPQWGKYTMINIERKEKVA